MWDMWQKKWHWDKFVSRVLGLLPVSIIPPWLSILIYHLGDEQKTPLVAAVQRESFMPST
jgi:hypothetical protein